MSAEWPLPEVALERVAATVEAERLIVANRDPVPDDVAVPLWPVVTFRVFDLGISRPDLAQIRVWVDGQLAFDQVVASAFANSDFYYDVDADSLAIWLRRNTPFASQQAVEVRVETRTLDGSATLEAAWWFTVEDRTAPTPVSAVAISTTSVRVSFNEDVRIPANLATLRRQFRMHRSIGKLVADLYYPEIGIEHGVDDEKRTLVLDGFGGDQRVFWLDVADGRERQTEGSTSRWNHEEIVAIEQMLTAWEAELSRKGTSYTVGVIAAYDDQRAKLLDRIRPGQQQRWKALRIRIDTVDAFQGKQDDIMLYSMVRANTSELRFIADRRRLNVAFSRAQRLLVIVGHRETAKLQPDLHKVVDAIPASAVITPKGDE